MAVARSLQSWQSATSQFPSIKAVDKLDSSASIMSARSAVSIAQMDQVQQPDANVAPTTTDDRIHSIERADTETGLRFTQIGRAVSRQAQAGSQVPVPRDQISLPSPKAKYKLVFLFWFQAGLLIFFAICLSGAVDALFYAVAIISLVGPFFVLAVKAIFKWRRWMNSRKGIRKCQGDRSGQS